MPALDPSCPVLIVTFGCCCLYAAAHVAMSGYSSELPFSERDCGPEAGADGIPPPGAARATVEVAFGLLPQAVASTSGAAAAAASNTRDLSATGRSLTVPAPCGTGHRPARAQRAVGSPRLASLCLASLCSEPRSARAAPSCHAGKRPSAAATAHAVVPVSGLLHAPETARDGRTFRAPRGNLCID